MKFLTLLLFGFTSFALSNEYQDIQDQVQQKFQESLKNRYEQIFLKNVKNYNDNRKKLRASLKKLKSAEDRLLFKKAVMNSKLTELPKIVLDKKRVARINTPKYRVEFSTLTMLNGYVVLNGKRVSIFKEDASSLKKKLLTDSSMIEKVLDLVIPVAYAKDGKFEYAIFSILISLREKFEDSEYCFSCEDEYREQTRKNFELIMKDMQVHADACNESSSSYYDIEMKVTDRYADPHNGTLAYNLEKYFKSISDVDGMEIKSASLNCEDIARKAYRDEIRDVAGRNTNQSYGGVLSEQAARNKELNNAAYSKFINSKCKPYVELRDCLITRKYNDARVLYNASRKEEGKPLIKDNWRSDEGLGEYNVEGTSR